VGLHAARQSGPYVAAHARLGSLATSQHGCAPDHGGLVHLRCMRGTLHALPASEAAVVHAATAPQRIAASAARLARCRVSPQTKARIAAAVQERVGENATTAQLTEALAGPFVESHVLAVLRDLWERGILTAWDSAGTPHRRERSFRLSASVPGWRPLEAEAASTTLLRWYLGTYGPASMRDIAWWTGWGMRRTEEARERLGNETIPVRVAGLSADLLALAADEETLRAMSAPPSDLAVLAYEDPAIKAYYETRGRYLDERCVPQRLFWYAGESLACVWKLGLVVATWRWSARTRAIMWTPTGRLSDDERDAIDAALQPTGAYLHETLRGGGR
jgi:hypothetical protein